MGKGTSAKPSKRRQESSEEPVDVDSEDQPEPYQSISDDEPQFNEAEENEALLKMISDKISQAPSNEEKLAWSALHTLRAEQGELRKRKEEEKQAIDDKYEKIEETVCKRISTVIGGGKLEKDLYTKNDQTSALNVAKVKPAQIDHFWATVFFQSGFLEGDDVEYIDPCTLFTCQIIDPKLDHMLITFQFEKGSPYFKNKVLSAEFKAVKAGQAERVIRHKIEYLKERNKQSIFTLLFDEASDPEEAFGLATNLYNVFTNSLSLYFFKGLENDAKLNEDDQESESEEDEVPKKKVKPDEIAKPECKQQ